ncbi:MAG: CoA transferase [Dehalococcoidia bacterium]
MSGPLVGIRVLDVGTMVAGPFAASLLADFGAEVIKVELPGRGDTLRQYGPVRQGSSYWFSADARNKKAITLDLRRPEGRALLLRLAAVSDALVENFVPGTLAGWGLDAGALRAANPRLIVAHASGYGQTGPYRTRPGYDRVGLAFGGLWHLTGDPDGPPMRGGVSIADYYTGLFGAFGIMMALYHRDARGGPGQEVDVSLFESVFRLMEFTVVQYGAEGVVRGRVGNSGPAAPAGAYRTRDGRWVMVLAGEDRQYQRLMRAIGREDLATDPRFATLPSRTANREVIEGAIGEWTPRHDLAEVMRIMEEADVPLGVSMTVADAFTDPQYAAREMVLTVDDPLYGSIAMQGVTPKLSETPGVVHRAGPLLGEHNATVYGDLLGLTAGDLNGLRDSGVV